MKPSSELIYQYRMSRERAERQAAERREAAYTALPRLKEIAEERREAAFEAGLAIMGGRDAAELRSKVELLNEEEQRLLLSAGLPPDYMLPHYRCKACNDTGYVGDTVKKLCPCMRARILEKMYATSGIDPLQSFALFRTDIYPGERQRRIALKAKELCQGYAASFPKCDPMGILLMGGTGLGKSYLLNAIALEVSSRGHDVYKTSAYNLIGAFMESIRGRGEPPDALAPALLIIDDLGTEPMINSVTRETLFSILNERQCARKATLWATNRSLDDILDSYGDRFFSRLVAPRETMVLPLEGDDLRLRLKQPPHKN